MRIKIDYSVDHYRADCLDLPGSPPVGLGSTEAEAVAHLFYRIINESSGPQGYESWIRFLEQTKEIEINGKKWEWSKSYCCS